MSVTTDVNQNKPTLIKTLLFKKYVCTEYAKILIALLIYRCYFDVYPCVDAKFGKQYLLLLYITFPSNSVKNNNLNVCTTFGATLNKTNRNLNTDLIICTKTLVFFLRDSSTVLSKDFQFLE